MCTGEHTHVHREVEGKVLSMDNFAVQAEEEKKKRMEEMEDGFAWFRMSLRGKKNR